MAVVQAIDVTPDQQKIILSLLFRYLPNTEAWVYGSRARWTSCAESDLDMVVFATPEQVPDVCNLREAFDESNLPFRVDLFVWDDLSENHRTQIKRDHMILAEANATGTTWRATQGIGSTDGAKQWRNSTWGEEIALKCGTALQDYSLDAGFYRVFGSNGPIGWTNTELVSGPGVILGHKGAYRGVEYSPDPFFVIDTAYYVESRSNHDMRWLYYAIKHYRLGELDDESPVPSTTRSAIYPRKLSVPSHSEQRAIACILGTLDDKIELNRRTNETLEEMARAIFRDWFFDIGPTRAKAEGRAPYLAPELWDLFPDAMDEEGKPVGWTVSEIGKEVHAVVGGTPNMKEPSYWNGGEHHWATPKDLSNQASPVLLDTDRKLTGAGLNEIGAGLLPIGTVLLSSRAPIGYLAITEVPTAVNQHFIAMVCDQRLPNMFVFFWCQANLEHMRDISGGSTFAEIGKSAFRPTPVTIPTDQVLAAYDRLIRPLYVRIVANTRESQTLADTRDLLLPRLMSGELRLSEAEQVIEAMA